MTVVEGERRFKASPERVFERLTSPDVVVAALPGLRGHRVVDADHWEAKIKPPFPLAPSVTIRFEVTERRAPEHAELRARGGGADIVSTFDLVAEGSGTLMRWRTELQLGGLLGRVAGPGLDSVADRQASRMLKAVDRSLRATSG